MKIFNTVLNSLYVISEMGKIRRENGGGYFDWK
jgi:hypothetical protein